MPAARPYGVSLAMRERVGLVLELGHGQDRAEDLLARDPPVVVDAVEDRRRDVEPAGLLPDALAAGRRPGRPPRGRARRSRGPSRAGARRRSSPSRVAGSSGSPGASRPADVRDPLDQLLAHAAVDDEPRAGVAGLAAVVEDPRPDGRGRRLEVADVGEHDLRALAAELERDRLDVGLADRAEQRPADLGRPGERDLVDAGMTRERIARCTAPGPGHDVEHAVRQTGLGGQLRQAQGASAATATPA